MLNQQLRSLLHTHIYLFRLKGGKLKVDKRPLPKYWGEEELLSILSNATGDVTAGLLRSKGLEDIVDKIEFPRQYIRFESLSDDTVCYQSNWGIFPHALNVANIQAKELLKDSQYDDVFDCCFDEKAYIQKKNEIESKINDYYLILEEFDKFIDSNDFGVEKIDDDRYYHLGQLCRIVVINNRPFLYFFVTLTSVVHMVYPISDYFAIKYNIQIECQGKLNVNYLLKDKQYTFRSFKKEERDELMSMIFDNPESYDKDIQLIADKIKQHFGKKISPSDSIRYDRMSCCYYLCDSIFKTVMAEFQPVIAGADIQYVGKYTSLNTLVEVLKSKKIRLNSIVSMNDKTEINFLKDIQKNYEETEDDNGLAVALANDINIISLTNKTDDLDMWRLYGDNGKGVCMIFKRNSQNDKELKKIKYIEPEKIPIIETVKEFLRDLQDNGINFLFHPMLKFCHYFKHKDYENEDEYRLIVTKGKPDGWFINRDNGLITPYIEMKLTDIEQNNMEGFFPYTLVAICLGPAFRDLDINAVQIREMCSDAEFTHVKIRLSEIKSYR